MKIFLPTNLDINILTKYSTTCQKIKSISKKELNNSTFLPNYFQVNKSFINFCSKKQNNSLDKYFGGYKKEKGLFDDLLLSPLNKKMQLPPSVLLVTPDKYFESKLLEGFIDTTQVNCVQVVANDDTNIDIIKKKLQDAKDNYDKKGEQTIIIIKNAESVIGMTPAYAREMSLIPLSEQNIKDIKKSGANLKKVNFFKSLLDAPYQKYATILFTTCKPQYIHPDLITRNGKMKTIIFPIPQGKNIKDIVKFEATQTNDTLKRLQINDDKLTERQQKQVNRLIINEKLSKMEIDKNDFPYQKIMNFSIPSKTKGAYTMQDYNEIMLKSLKDYIKQPQTPFYIHFVFNLSSQKRSLDSESFIQYDSMKYILSL